MSDGRPAIVGVGSVLMGDDGVGPAAVEAMRRAGLGGRAELIDAGLGFSDVLCELDPARPIVVIDAVRAGGPAGTIYRFPASALEGQASPGQGVSLHELSVLPALRLEALAGRRFEDVTIFGVEPERIEWGVGLSPAAAGAVERLVPAIQEYVEHCQNTPAQQAGRSENR